VSEYSDEVLLLNIMLIVACAGVVLLLALIDKTKSSYVAGMLLKVTEAAVPVKVLLAISILDDGIWSS